MPIEDVDRIIDASLETMPGWCTPTKAKRMARLVMAAGAGAVTVELGVYGGRGTVALALPIVHLFGGMGRVYAVDPFTVDAAAEGYRAESTDHLWWLRLDYQAMFPSAQAAITRLGVAPVVHFIQRRSHDAARAFTVLGVDVLHQDGNHSEQVSCEEVADWAPKMKPGGVWIADDTDWPSTEKSQGMLLDRGFLKEETYDNWAIFRAPTSSVARARPEQPDRPR